MRGCLVEKVGSGSEEGPDHLLEHGHLCGRELAGREASVLNEAVEASFERRQQRRGRRFA